MSLSSGESTVIEPDLILATQTLVRANQLLYTNQCRPAGLLYTDVLKDFPSHPIALLNRSWCFIGVRKPQLAVMDAQLVYMATFRSEGRMDEVTKQTHLHAEACKMVASRGAQWLSLPVELLGVPAEARSTMYLAHIGALVTDNNDALAIRAKALFHLGAALWKCGNGALRTALGILERSKTELALTPDTRKEVDEQFKWLSNRIIIAMGYLFHNSSDLRKAEYQNLLATGYTPVSAPSMIELSHGRPPHGHEARLNQMIQELDRGSAVGFAVHTGGRTLVTTKAASSGDTLFNEHTPLSVTTATSTVGGLKYCETCCAEIDGPARFREDVSSDSSSPSDTCADDYIHPKTVFGCPSHEFDQRARIAKQALATRQREQNNMPRVSGMPPPLPPHYRASSARFFVSTATDLQVCHNCDPAMYWCSHRCSPLKEDTAHSLMCGNVPAIAHRIRRATSDKTQALAPQPHERTIISLLLLRLVSWARAQNESAFDLPAIRLLAEASQKRVVRAIGRVPWSYESNVILPLNIITAACATRAERAQLDGKTINALIEIIRTHMRTTRDMPWMKCYNSAGQHIATLGPEDAQKKEELRTLRQQAATAEAAEQLAEKYPSQAPPRRDSAMSEEHPASRPSGEIWFGSMHPLCGLVPIAPNPSDANAEFVALGDDTVLCIALADMPADTPLFVASAHIRPATQAERTKFSAMHEQASEAEAEAESEPSLSSWWPSSSVASSEGDGGLRDDLTAFVNEGEDGDGMDEDIEAYGAGGGEVDAEMADAEDEWETESEGSDGDGV